MTDYLSSNTSKTCLKIYEEYNTENILVDRMHKIFSNSNLTIKLLQTIG